VSLDPSPDEASLEKMMFLYINREYAQGETAAEKILESDPGNEVALQYLHFCASWTKGYPGAGKLLADHLKAIQLSDRMRIYQALYRFIEADTAESRGQIRRLAGQYPPSGTVEYPERRNEKDIGVDEEEMPRQWNPQGQPHEDTPPSSRAHARPAKSSPRRLLPPKASAGQANRRGMGCVSTELSTPAGCSPPRSRWRVEASRLRPPNRNARP